MAVVKLVEPYAITQGRKDVRDALTLTGEQCIALQMYHPINDPDAPRCPSCYNALYKQAKEYACPDCYGTTFEGGIKEIDRIWAIFTQNDNNEPINNQGVWNADNRNVQMEAFPILSQRDYIVRVKRWGPNFTPLAVDGIWATGRVNVQTLRTGSMWDTQEYAGIGQFCTSNLMPDNHPIYSVPILGISFAEGVGEDTPVEPARQPDTRVVYFPISGPGAGTQEPPVFNSDGFTHIQQLESDTWTISNPLGRTPAACTVYINDEVWEVDEEYPNPQTIILRFAEPVSGRAEFV